MPSVSGAQIESVDGAGERILANIWLSALLLEYRAEVLTRSPLKLVRLQDELGLGRYLLLRLLLDQLMMMMYKVLRLLLGYKLPLLRGKLRHELCRPLLDELRLLVLDELRRLLVKELRRSRQLRQRKNLPLLVRLELLLVDRRRLRRRNVVQENWRRLHVLHGLGRVEETVVLKNWLCWIVLQDFLRRRRLVADFLPPAVLELQRSLHEIPRLFVYDELIITRQGYRSLNLDIVTVFALLDEIGSKNRPVSGRPYVLDRVKLCLKILIKDRVIKAPFAWLLTSELILCIERHS